MKPVPGGPYKSSPFQGVSIPEGRIYIEMIIHDWREGYHTVTQLVIYNTK